MSAEAEVEARRKLASLPSNPSRIREMYFCTLQTTLDHARLGESSRFRRLYRLSAPASIRRSNTSPNRRPRAALGLVAYNDAGSRLGSDFFYTDT